MERLVAMLRAAGDPTRLRLLLLLGASELTVSELIHIIGQSQPRVSRHLKLLCEAKLLLRFKEGAFVFYRAADGEVFAELPRLLGRAAAELDDSVLTEDRRRLAEVRAGRTAKAADYFKANAPQWERIRTLHAPDQDVEQAIAGLLAGEEIATVLDAGTGTGRMLELLAPHIKRGIGIDSSPEMLAIAREKLAFAQHCQVRRGDLYRLPFADGEAHAGFDAVIFHQVLHYLDEPQAALAEAARVLKPGGRILVADFAPHELEFLRSEHAHRRLGFSDREVQSWFKATGLKPVEMKAFSPGEGSERLTVMLWLAQAQGVRRPARVVSAA